MGDGTELLGVQPAEERVETGGRIALGDVRRGEVEAVPDGDLLERNRFAANAGAGHGVAAGGWIGGHDRSIVGPRDSLSVSPVRAPTRQPSGALPAPRRP